MTPAPRSSLAIRAVLIAFLLVGLRFPAAALTADEELTLGSGDPGAILQGSISVSGSEDGSIRVTVLASDPNLKVEPTVFALTAGQTEELSVSLTLPDSERGEIVRLLTLLPEGGEPVVSIIRAEIIGEPEEVQPPPAIGGVFGFIDLYMDTTCPKCRDLSDDEIPSVLGTLPVRIVEHDIMVPEKTDELLARLTAAGVELDELPVAILTLYDSSDGPATGSAFVFQGFERIPNGIEIALETPGLLVEDPSSGGGDLSSVLTVGAVIGAGLLDGINPCAFSTMLFLISMLAVAGRTRKEILVIGIVYSLTVFAGYVAAGFGLFAGVRTLMVFPVLVSVMRWTLFGLLIVLAGLSVRDAVLAGQGRSSEMTLQLPDKFKRRVHDVVRTGTRSASLVGGTILLGIGVTIFEFSCTGQVYVPVIMHLARAGSGMAVGLLLLYNVAFIVPLLIVFGLAFAGISMKKVGSMFADRLVLVKVGLAVVFAGFAILTVAM